MLYVAAGPPFVPSVQRSAAQRSVAYMVPRDQEEEEERKKKKRGTVYVCMA